MEKLPHIAIAILNYNGRHFFEQFLPTLWQLQYPNYSVWVIDNASTDDSISYLQQNEPSVRIIQNPWNGGYAAGYNMGLEHIRAAFCLLLNSDVAVTSNLLNVLIEPMLENDRIAAIQPKILSYSQPHQFEYAGAGGGMIDSLGYPFCRGRLFDSTEKDVGQYNNSQPIFWASGAAILVRKAAFDQLGGFYGYFFMHNEEIDWCWRAQNKGWQIAYCGETCVYHLGGGSLNKESPRKTYLNFRNNLVMNVRNQPVLQLSWSLPTRLLLDLAACLQLLQKGNAPNAWNICKAWVHFLGWLVVPAKDKWPGNRGWGTGAGYYKGSIVWQYFVKGKKAYPF